MLCHSLKYAAHSGPKMVLVEERKHQINEKILEYLGFQGLFNKMHIHTYKARAGLCVHVHCCFLLLVWGFFVGVFVLGLFFFGWVGEGYTLDTGTLPKLSIIFMHISKWFTSHGIGGEPVSCPVLTSSKFLLSPLQRWKWCPTESAWGRVKISYNCISEVCLPCLSL